MLKLIIKLICVVLLEILCNFVAIYAWGVNGIFLYLSDIVTSIADNYITEGYIWWGVIVAIVVSFQIGVVKIYKIKPFEKKVYKIVYSVLSGGLALYIILFYVLMWTTEGSIIMDILYPYLT